MAHLSPLGTTAQIIALPGACSTPVIQTARSGGRHPKSIALLWRYRAAKAEQRYAEGIYREEQETLRNGIAIAQSTLERMRYTLARNQQLAQSIGASYV